MYILSKSGVFFITADHGYVEGKHVDEFFQHIVKKLGVTVSRLFIFICVIKSVMSMLL